MSDEIIFNYDKSNLADQQPAKDDADSTLLGGAKGGEDESPPKENNPMGDGTPTAKPSFLSEGENATPPSVRQARETAEHNPYLATQLAEAGKHLADIADGADADLLDSKAQAAHQANTRELATIVLVDFGGSPTDAQLLRDEVKRFENFTAEEHEAAQRETTEALQRALGDDFHASLKLMRDFVSRDPRVVRFLLETGTGNSLPLARRILEMARAHALRGGK